MRRSFALRAGGRVRRPYVTWTRKGSDQLFFLYQGHRAGLLQDKPVFIEKSGLIDRNFAFLRDESRRRYQHGISDAIPNIPALINWQKGYAASLPHVKRMFCLGTSYGGYAALVFGHALRVETVWAFAPQTLLSNSRSGYENVAKLLASDNGRTEYRVYYCENNPTDLACVERIAACPGVRAIRVPGADHDVIAALDAEGALGTLLPPPTGAQDEATR